MWLYLSAWMKISAKLQIHFKLKVYWHSAESWCKTLFAAFFCVDMLKLHVRQQCPDPPSRRQADTHYCAAHSQTEMPPGEDLPHVLWQKANQASARKWKPIDFGIIPIYSKWKQRRKKKKGQSLVEEKEHIKHSGHRSISEDESRSIRGVGLD